MQCLVRADQAGPDQDDPGKHNHERLAAEHAPTDDRLPAVLHTRAAFTLFTTEPKIKPTQRGETGRR